MAHKISTVQKYRKGNLQTLIQDQFQNNERYFAQAIRKDTSLIKKWLTLSRGMSGMSARDIEAKLSLPFRTLDQATPETSLEDNEKDRPGEQGTNVDKENRKELSSVCVKEVVQLNQIYLEISEVEKMRLQASDHTGAHHAMNIKMAVLNLLQHLNENNNEQ